MERNTKKKKEIKEIYILLYSLICVMGISVCVYIVCVCVYVTIVIMHLTVL